MLGQSQPTGASVYHGNKKRVRVAPILVMGNCRSHHDDSSRRASIKSAMSGSIRAARAATKGSKRLASSVTRRILENTSMVDHRETGRDVYDYYDVVDQIGTGTTCHVFAVEKKTAKKKRVTATTKQEPKQLYTLKKIYKEWVDDEFVEEVRNEVKILRTLHHPNIVRVYDLFESEAEIYIVMEYCSGGDLYSRAPYTEEQSSKIMSKLLSAVAYLHRAGIVHRDIKMENILFESPDPLSEIKLIDFGFATERKHNLRKVVGTVYTISPQVLQGKYTEKADEWSCGVIAYILLCNRKPFDGQVGQEIAKKIERGFFYEGSEFAALSETAKAFIRSLLAYDEAERYSASRALRSAWLAKTSPRDLRRPEIEIVNYVTKALIQSANDSRFKKLAMQLIAHNTAREETETLRRVFDYFDGNDDGLITYWEFSRALKQYDNRDEDIKKMFAGMDVYGKKSVNYSEYIASTLEAGGSIDDDRILAAFKRLDSKDLGYISKETLCPILGNNCDDDYIATVTELIKEVDTSGDGKISYNEFLALFREDQTASNGS